MYLKQLQALFALLPLVPAMLSAQETRTPAPTDPVAFEPLWRARQDSLRLKVNAADVQFMIAMIEHHAQAIRMSNLAPQNGASQSVQRLAARIVKAQRDEIAIMRRWLSERKQAVPEVHEMGGTLMVHMPGAAMDHGAGHDDTPQWRGC